MAKTTSPYSRMAANYNISELRNNTAELAIGNGINHEQISNMVKNEDANNSKIISRWNK